MDCNCFKIYIFKISVPHTFATTDLANGRVNRNIYARQYFYNLKSLYT